MPGQRKPGTRTRSFGCEDELWEAALETSGRVGPSISQVLRDALADFVASNALERVEAPAPAPAPATLLDLFDPLRPCPACGSGLDLRGGVWNEAAWSHMETCPGLVALAKDAGII